MGAIRSSSFKPQRFPIKRFEILIAGGGIGGLALAQALRKAGISVRVFERDRTRTDRLQGYRLHISPFGSQALRQCLPDALFTEFERTCGEGNKGFSFFNEQLEELLYLDSSQDATSGKVDIHRSVSRMALRQLLLSGLEDTVQFDKTLVRFELRSGDRVAAIFNDGKSEEGDLLVGAEGGNSAVRRQYLPHAERMDTGVIGLMGKVDLSPDVLALLPPKLLHGPGFILMQGGFSAFLAVQKFSHRPEAEAAIGVLRDYAMWAVAAHQGKLGALGLKSETDAEQVRSVALRALAQSHPNLSHLVELSEGSTLIATHIRSAKPVHPWTPGHITLIGDAIHSMTPFRGVGANTALRDAALLSQELVAASQGRKSLLEAVGSYEEQMRKYGFAAVRASLSSMRQSTSNRPIRRRLMQMVLRSINKRPQWKQWVADSYARAPK